MTDRPPAPASRARAQITARPSTPTDAPHAPPAHAGNLDEAWRLLERTHILSQPWAWPTCARTSTCCASPCTPATAARSLGQLVRLLVAGPGSAVGRYPLGNTGRSNVPATQPMPIPEDLAELLTSR